VTSGDLTEEMIKEYLDHHFEPKVEDNFRIEG
jgi:putative transposase